MCKTHCCSWEDVPAQAMLDEHWTLVPDVVSTDGQTCAVTCFALHIVIHLHDFLSLDWTRFYVVFLCPCVGYHDLHIIVIVSVQLHGIASFINGSLLSPKYGYNLSVVYIMDSTFANQP
jgi:hypothetical protein